MKAFGLTGNIGSGKSTVAKLLEKLGVVVIFCDLVAKAIAASLLYRSEINEILGTDVFPNNQIDFKKIASIIFNDTEKKRMYEQFIHPLVWEEVRKIVEKNMGSMCVVENALIYQKNDEFRFEFGILVARCSKKERLRRLVDPEKRNMAKKDVLLRMIHEYKNPEKHPATRFSINTNCDLTMLENRVLVLYQKLKKEFTAKT